ncbi:hypothetical protein CF15_01775 [Pyrodictium occultum]|uniref:Serine aminopeptidase S33 domain-containing protein n=1 Tax=Pyrodictium occultum TaxID=2309 RepID=A0A0V8RUB7_PYROC|nr:alpha/beta fold hydrolase [Pyrodictium occultum]KSW11587.1 hypothetical protein CF15_01775 [Pyrodictium occultum]
MAIVLLAALPLYVAYSGLHPARCRPGQPPGWTSHEDFNVSTRDGVVLRGWVLNPQGPGDTVFILMHGYTGCRSSHYVMLLARQLVSMGYPVVVFDFRGHGLSGGTTTIGPREVLDAEAVVGYTASRFPHKRIALVGFSMGAAVAVVEGSRDPRVYAVVADSPYYSLRLVVPRWIEYKTPLPGWIGSLAAAYASALYGIDAGFGPAEVRKLDKPLLVIHGGRDPW